MESDVELLSDLTVSSGNVHRHTHTHTLHHFQGHYITFLLQTVAQRRFIIMLIHIRAFDGVSDVCLQTETIAKS